MPRLMSFAMTTRQFRQRTKTVTRRLGWWNLKPGEIVEGVEKAQGLKAGEKVKRLGRIRIVSIEAQPLKFITADDVVREGFPELTPQQFVEMFMRHNGMGAGDDDRFVNRIEFEYVD